MKSIVRNYDIDMYVISTVQYNSNMPIDRFECIICSPMLSTGL